MITKFLYQMNVVKKRILTGLVENDVDTTYDPLREIPMVLEDGVKLEEGERVVSNFGELYYGVFKENNEYRYVNINDFMLKVKVNASDKVAFATPLSKDMIDSILDNTNYLDCDFDFNYVKSGFFLRDDKEYDDSFKVFFRKVTDDVYVQKCENNTTKFLSVVDGQYKFVPDFKDAMRVYKREVRNLLVTHGIVSQNTNKNELFMSHYNIFKNSLTNEFLFGGDNSFKVSYSDSNITITKEPKLTSDFHLVNDDTRSVVLRGILYLLKGEESSSKHAVKIDSKYVEETSPYSFNLVDNAARATLISDTKIDVLKKAIQLYNQEAKVIVLQDFDSKYYLYQNENEYELTKEVKDVKSILVNEEDANAFIEAFRNDAEKDLILLKDESYISINFKNENTFVIEYLKSGYNASTFSKEQADLLSRVLHKKLYKRELGKTFNSEKLLNINTKEVKSVIDSYNDFLAKKNASSIRFGMYQPDYASLKVGSDKAAFEYLEALYVKGVLDTKNVIDKVITRTNNILVVGSTVTLDLMGIALSCNEHNKSCHVSILDTTKWGFYPEASIGTNLVYDGAYRLELESLTKEFINQFDCILISKKFSANKEALLDLIQNLEHDQYNGYIINLSLNKDLHFDNQFYDAINGYTSFKKYIPNFNEEELYNTYGTRSLLDNKLSYFSIFKVKKNKLTDIIKNK